MCPLGGFLSLGGHSLSGGHRTSARHGGMPIPALRPDWHREPRMGPRIPGNRWAAGSDPSRSRGAAHRQEASRGGGGRLAEPCSNGAAAAASAASHRLRYRPQPARCGRPAPGPAPGPAPAPLAPWTHSRGATQEGREQCPAPQPVRGTSRRRSDFAVRDARLRSGSSRSCLLPGWRKLCGCVWMSACLCPLAKQLPGTCPPGPSRLLVGTQCCSPFSALRASALPGDARGIDVPGVGCLSPFPSLHRPPPTIPDLNTTIVSEGGFLEKDWGARQSAPLAGPPLLLGGPGKSCS